MAVRKWCNSWPCAGSKRIPELTCYFWLAGDRAADRDLPIVVGIDDVEQVPHTRAQVDRLLGNATQRACCLSHQSITALAVTAITIDITIGTTIGIFAIIVAITITIFVVVWRSDDLHAQQKSECSGSIDD